MGFKIKKIKSLYVGLELTLGDMASLVGCRDHNDLTGVYVITSIPAVVPVTCLNIISTDPDYFFHRKNLILIE